MALMEIAVVLGGLAAADVVAARAFKLLYRNERKPDATHFCRTDDGWTLALHEYRPPREIQTKRPVICCHGLSGNHHGFDLAARTSLARFLAAAGHPTFVLDLRGAGASEKGGLTRGKPLHWKLSDHYGLDAPAAVACVRRLTGADRVHWIGHSMGGMVAYAFLQSELAKQISRVVILASPGTFSFMRPLHKLSWLTKLMPGLPLRTLAASVAPLFESMRLLQNISGNLDLLPGHAALSAANCQGQTPSRLITDFMTFIRAGHYQSDRGENLLEGLADVRTPMLFMVGEADMTARAGAVRAAYEACGAKMKKMIRLGPEHGHQGIYGHMTILLGPHVYDEVFPHITEWLAQ